MLSFEEAQATLIATINTGPDALDPSLFAGSADRILLGLKAHANTINHARLTALEASFPLTRAALGEFLFNTLSHRYAESVIAGTLDNNRIGSQFAAFLESADVGVAEYELAQIEWAYLKSYHAPEARALCLADLSHLKEATLLAHSIALHPSVQVVDLTVPISASLKALAGLAPPVLLLVRPEAEVRLHPLNAQQLVLLRAAGQINATIGNLLAIGIEQGEEATPLEAVTQLIEAGALITTG
jgi:Putative DNA-binding domain